MTRDCTDQQVLIKQPPVDTDKTKISPRQARADDALTLARLIYDVFKESRRDGRVRHGQNNANQTEYN